MKKLLPTVFSSLFLCLAITLQAQKSVTSGGAYSHLARFSVYDYHTKAPIQNAVVVNNEGSELGYTDNQGDLALQLPPSSTEYYTVRAEGYNPMSIRLTQAEKKNGDYEVFLPEASHRMAQEFFEETPVETKPELVKVYVKQEEQNLPKAATNISSDEVIFSVQVSASSIAISEAAAENEWGEFGPVYVQKENGMYKVRIGPYETQQDAKQILLAVKSKGRKDAFIAVGQKSAYDKPIAPKPTPRTNESPKAQTVSQSMQSGDYKVRIASYLRPGDFNTNGLDQLGKLESYRKGEWTIMMLGGYRTEAEARKVQEVIIGKGFKDAEVVVERDGLLETVK